MVFSLLIRNSKGAVLNCSAIANFWLRAKPLMSIYILWSSNFIKYRVLSDVCVYKCCSVFYQGGSIIFKRSFSIVVRNWISRKVLCSYLASLGGYSNENEAI